MSKPERILGIDYGIKRIGVAIGDLDSKIAMPLTTVDGRNDVTRDARNIADLAADHGANALVVGLPLNMDGSSGPQVELTQRFARELERLANHPVHLQDERLSTMAAHEALDEAGVKSTRRRDLADRIAAQKILQAWFDRQ